MDNVPEAIFTHTSLLWITPDSYGYPPSFPSCPDKYTWVVQIRHYQRQPVPRLNTLPKRCSCSPGQMPAIDIKFQTPELIADALPARVVCPHNAPYAAL
jgi:hypothetical protein